MKTFVLFVLGIGLFLALSGISVQLAYGQTIGAPPAVPTAQTEESKKTEDSPRKDAKNHLEDLQFGVETVFHDQYPAATFHVFNVDYALLSQESGAAIEDLVQRVKEAESKTVVKINPGRGLMPRADGKLYATIGRLAVALKDAKLTHECLVSIYPGSNANFTQGNFVARAFEYHEMSEACASKFHDVCGDKVHLLVEIDINGEKDRSGCLDFIKYLPIKNGNCVVGLVSVHDKVIDPTNTFRHSERVRQNMVDQLAKANLKFEVIYSKLTSTYPEDTREVACALLDGVPMIWFAQTGYVPEDLPALINAEYDKREAAKKAAKNDSGTSKEVAGNKTP